MKMQFLKYGFYGWALITLSGCELFLATAYQFESHHIVFRYEAHYADGKPVESPLHIQFMNDANTILYEATADSPADTIDAAESKQTLMEVSAAKKAIISVAGHSDIVIDVHAEWYCSMASCTLAIECGSQDPQDACPIRFD